MASGIVIAEKQAAEAKKGSCEATSHSISEFGVTSSRGRNEGIA